MKIDSWNVNDYPNLYNKQTREKLELVELYLGLPKGRAIPIFETSFLVENGELSYKYWNRGPVKSMLDYESTNMIRCRTRFVEHALGKRFKYGRDDQSRRTYIRRVARLVYPVCEICDERYPDGRHIVYFGKGEDVHSACKRCVASLVEVPRMEVSKCL